MGFNRDKQSNMLVSHPSFQTCPERFKLEGDAQFSDSALPRSEDSAKCLDNDHSTLRPFEHNKALDNADLPSTKLARPLQDQTAIIHSNQISPSFDNDPNPRSSS